MRCGETLSSCPVPLTTTSTCVSTLGGGSATDHHDCMRVDSRRRWGLWWLLSASVTSSDHDDDCMGVDSRQLCCRQLLSVSVTAWRALDQASVGVCDGVRRFRAVWCRWRWWCWRLSVSVTGWREMDPAIELAEMAGSDLSEAQVGAQSKRCYPS